MQLEPITAYKDDCGFIHLTKRAAEDANVRYAAAKKQAERR